MISVSRFFSRNILSNNRALSSNISSISSQIPNHVKRCYYTGKPKTRSYRRRETKRQRAREARSLDEAQFERALTHLLPRFTPEELSVLMAQQDDPRVCFELFNWASQQPRFKHNAHSYRVAVEKLGRARMYLEMDEVVGQALAVSSGEGSGDEELFNTMIVMFVRAGKLNKAVNIFRHMKASPNLNCRPSIKTYNTLFAALLRRGKNTFVNALYMNAFRFLFRQMVVDDGIEPDTLSLNSVIKGYVMSLHLNDALRIFHQMGVVYKCLPNSYTYDYLIYGLCAQGRTRNARELYDQMTGKGFVPNEKSYNSLVNAFALEGDIDEAVRFLWEMIGKRKTADLITYKTVLDEMCRKGKVGEATKLLKELRERNLVDELAYGKLSYVLEDDYEN